MDASEILGRIGVTGFLSVFQAAAVGLGAVLFVSAREEMRKGRRRDAVLLSLVLLVPLLFAAMPLAFAHNFNGWPGLLAQLAILGILVRFALIPTPPARAERPATPLLARLLDAPSEPVARWRRIASALPAFAAAAVYGAALAGLPLPGTTRGALCHGVGIEFLVIHSFPFLSAITLARIRTRRWRIFQWFLFATWSCLYLGFAAEGRHGWSGVAGFASGAVVTYLGFLLRWGSGNRVAALVKRWAASTLFFVVAAALTGSRNFGDSDATLLHGVLYFAALGLAEACGLHDLDWRNAFRRRRGRPSRRERPRVPAEPVGR